MLRCRSTPIGISSVGSTALFFASAAALEFFASASDLESLGFDHKTEFVADLILDGRNLLAFEFYDLVAVLADDVVMIGMIRIVGIVKLVVLPKVHFAHQSALRQQRQGAVDGSAGD